MNLSWNGQVRGPLVATPVPDRRETAIGYVMRLAQANGYHSPSAFLPKAGETQASVLGGSPRTLHALTGMSLEWAERLAIDKAPRGYKVLGHAVAPRDLRVDLHRICPLCVERDGILDASWHLACVTHCATHGIALAERCDSCGSGLRLSRPSVAICRCERVVRNVGHSVCSPELQTLMQALRARLYGDKRIAPSPRGLPYFDHLDLPTLIAVVRSLHDYLSIQRKKPSHGRVLAADLVEVVAQAMHAFKDGLLSVQAVLHRDCASPPAADPRRQSAFDWYYDRTFGLRSVPELSFIGNTIYSTVRGGSDKFSRPTQAPKEACKASTMAGGGGKAIKTAKHYWGAQWVPLDEFAVRTRCPLDGLRRAIDMKFVRSTAQGADTLAVHRNELRRVAPSQHDGLEAGEAAKRLGISPSLFRCVARPRVMLKTHIPRGGGPFALEDLDAIRKSRSSCYPHEPYLRKPDPEKRERYLKLMRRLETEPDLPDAAPKQSSPDDEALSRRIVDRTVAELCAKARARRSKIRPI